MPPAAPRRAFTTLVRDALASARASRQVRPIHAQVKPATFEAPAVSNRNDGFGFARVDLTPVSRAALFKRWREPHIDRGTAKLPSFRFPVAEVSSGGDADVASSQTSPGVSGEHDVTSASAASSAIEATHSEQLREFATNRRDAVLANTLGAEFGARAMRSFHSPVRKHMTLDPLVSEYSVDSPEGVALMSLAEALIRVPSGADAYMPDRLIRDTIGARELDFMALMKSDKRALVNASAVRAFPTHHTPPP